MAGANSNIQLSGLDFDTIKTNLKTFLRSQDTFKDYNFEGAGLSVLLDILAYNTQYNAFYLNMIGNEMFFDTALQRSSVVSQAKVLNYTPKSSTAPTAFINVSTINYTDSSVTLPAYTNFLSESVDGINYNFVTTDATTVNVSSNTANFIDIQLKQGIPVSYTYTVDGTTNPSYTFELPDNSIDTSTILVEVFQSSSSSAFDIYNLADGYSSLDGTSLVYFLQESINGNYEILFGDGILGKKLTDGNVVNVRYIITQGSLSAGANNFVLMDTISGFGTTVVTPVIPSSDGSGKETIESIKFQAPKSFAAQKRAVTKDDYITHIKQNKIGLTFDDVNVWGGEKNDPPVYGKVFVCLKPTSGYFITNSQKQKLIKDVIEPLSVITVEPTIIDPDYTYIQIITDVVYDDKKTNLSSTQLQQLIKSVVYLYCTSNLNKFSSTLSVSDIGIAIKNASNAIITSNIKIKLQKKILPDLINATTYNLYYGSSLERGMFQSGISSSPSIDIRNPSNLANTITGIYIEEIPSSTGGVDSISIINPGFGYQTAPTITILGDGTGATAKSYIDINGSLTSIEILEPGSGYTSAIATITNNIYDTTGQLGSVSVNLQSRYGTLRTYYNDSKNVKKIVNETAGTVDYNKGLITLNAFNPLNIENDVGQLTISATPTTTIVSSTYNRILTIDSADPQSIIVNVSVKK